MSIQALRNQLANVSWKKFFFYSIPVFVLLGIIGTLIAIFTEDSVDKFTNKPQFVAVVMSRSDKTFKIPEEFSNGFGSKTTFQEITKQTISIERFDDLNSPEQAKVIANKLIQNPNCIMIIGNSNSELSEATLNCLLEADPTNRPSYILPIATADNITSLAYARDYKSILRMVPNNDDQANIITQFIFTNINKKPKIAILVDDDNKTYSNNLSKNIAEKIANAKGSIIYNKSYGNQSRFIDQYITLKSQSLIPDVIIYVGITSNGMLLIDELEALKINTPVIFTDGCTVKDLMERTQKIKNDCYFLSSISKSDKGIEPTYGPIGTDAYLLVAQILNDISINQDINRKTVSDYISNSKGKINIEGGTSAGTYAFESDGNNKSMHFHVYKYINGVLTEVTNN